MSIGSSYSNIATSPTTTLYDRATAAHSNNAHGRSHSLDDFTIYYRILPRDITIAYIYSPRIGSYLHGGRPIDAVIYKTRTSAVADKTPCESTAATTA